MRWIGKGRRSNCVVVWRSRKSCESLIVLFCVVLIHCFFDQGVFPASLWRTELNGTVAPIKLTEHTGGNCQYVVQYVRENSLFLFWCFLSEVCASKT